MTKILRSEGKTPSGAAELFWPTKVYFDKVGDNIGGDLTSRGEPWRRVRTFIQSDLLSPASSLDYVPNILHAAKYCSRGAPHYQDAFNSYLDLASFDMFHSVMLGYSPRSSDPTCTEKSPEDVALCKHISSSLRLGSKATKSPYDTIMNVYFGITTKLFKSFADEFSSGVSLAKPRLTALFAKEKGTEMEERSYARKAQRRVRESETDLTEEDVLHILSGLTLAGVDTTAGYLSWRFLHIALDEEAQERILAELPAGDLTVESVLPKNAPYLHACIRESHRLANNNVTIPVKTLQQDLEVHGVMLKKGDVVALDGYSQGVDPEIVGVDAMEFKPERFLSDAVNARKGTKAGDILDHALFGGPFSQGARRCPGSRVAHWEAVVLLAQLVKDWKISVPGVKHWTEVPYTLQTVTTATIPPLEFTPR